MLATVKNSHERQGFLTRDSKQNRACTCDAIVANQLLRYELMLPGPAPLISFPARLQVLAELTAKNSGSSESLAYATPRRRCNL